MAHDTDTKAERQARMKALLDSLGGREAVLKDLDRSESAMKEWMARAAFAPNIYGAFLRLGHRKQVRIPRDLFGFGLQDHWMPDDASGGEAA